MLPQSIIAFTRDNLGTRLMPSLFKACVAASVVFLLYRLAWFRRRPDVHSFSMGRTRLRLPVSDSFAQRYIEPLACFAAGALLFRLDGLFGTWLVGAGISLFAEEQIARIQGRKRLLDTLDGRAEGRALQTAVQNQIAPQQSVATHTPVTIAVKRRTRRTTRASKLASRLDPALRRILDPDTTQDSGESP